MVTIVDRQYNRGMNNREIAATFARIADLAFYSW
jgi:hypothetical protein